MPRLGRTWASLGSIPLNLQKSPRNLGKPAPALIARLSELAEGRGWGRARRNGHGELLWKKTPRTPSGLPRAPWQMSVRVAPSTMNWGFESSSCKRPRVLSLGQPLLEIGTQPSQTPLPTRNLESLLGTQDGGKLSPTQGSPSYRGTLPLDTIGFGGVGTQVLVAQALGHWGEGVISEEGSPLQAVRLQLLIILAHVFDGIFMAAQAQLLGPQLLHLCRHPGAVHRGDDLLRHPEGQTGLLRPQAFPGLELGLLPALAHPSSPNLRLPHITVLLTEFRILPPLCAPRKGAPQALGCAGLHLPTPTQCYHLSLPRRPLSLACSPVVCQTARCGRAGPEVTGNWEGGKSRERLLRPRWPAGKPLP